MLAGNRSVAVATEDEFVVAFGVGPAARLTAARCGSEEQSGPFQRLAVEEEGGGLLDEIDRILEPSI